MRAFEDDGELSAASYFDSDRAYTRNLVAHEDGLFTLLLLCWTWRQQLCLPKHRLL